MASHRPVCLRRPSVRVLTCLLLAACAGPRDAAPRADAAQPGETAAAATVATASPAANLITPTSIAGIELGATLADIRRALPAAQFRRTSDGDGAALIELTLAPDVSLTIWAGEDDADAAIDWAQQVQMIETRSPAFATPEGVRAGAPVTDVVQRYGPVREVVVSEIESRQYVTFERQPAHLAFRLDYSGVFAEGERTTKVVAPGGTIHSIAIASGN